jgi:hypothetical protein
MSAENRAMKKKVIILDKERKEVVWWVEFW